MLKQSRKKASKGLYFTCMSDQRPHPSAAKSWSRCKSPLQYGVSQCFNVDCIPGTWGGVAVQHAVEKTFLVAQPVQPVALTSQVACYQSTIVSGGHNRRKPAGIARRDPPRGEVSSAPFGTHRYQIANRVGCLLGL